MMLDGPDRVIAEAVRKFHLLRGLVVDVVHEAGVVRTAPLNLILQREFHRLVPSVSPSGVSRVRARGGLCGRDCARSFPGMNLAERVAADKLDRPHDAL